MTKIELFEDIINERNFGILKELNISSALFRSYEETRYLGLDFITFMDIIWEDDFKVLAQNLKDFEIDKIILRLPKHMTGDVGIRGNISLDFKKQLETKGYEVILWDERLSSKAATNVLIQGNVSRKNRKKIIDQIAAVIILQGYLDSLKK